MISLSGSISNTQDMSVSMDLSSQCCKETPQYMSVVSRSSYVQYIAFEEEFTYSEVCSATETSKCGHAVRRKTTRWRTTSRVWTIWDRVGCTGNARDLRERGVLLGRRGKDMHGGVGGRAGKRYVWVSRARAREIAPVSPCRPAAPARAPLRADSCRRAGAPALRIRACGAPRDACMQCDTR
jgi:hypothetical protein